jgi:peroxiredoxin
MKQGKNKFQIFLYFISTLLLVANIFLIYQNLSLRTQLKVLEPLRVEEGDTLGVFQAKNLKGEEVEIDYSQSKKNILLFFRTTCGYCEKQMPYWKELASGADKQNYKVAAITTETNTQAIENYIQKYKIQDWKVLIIAPEEAQTAKLLATPVTIVVDNKGVVEKVWTGMWQTNDIDSASKYFALNFSETSKAK